MNYIINPAWFYWVNVLNTFHNSLVAGVFTCGFLIVSCGIAFTVAMNAVNEWPSISDGERRCFPIFTRIFKVSTIMFPILLVLLVFTPSKNTLLEMQIAKYVTVENAEWTLETIKSAVDYIVEAIKSVK